MAGTDRVEVQLLHGDDFLAHAIFGDIPSGFRAEIMPVHSADDKAFSVQRKHARFVDLQMPEAYPAAFNIEGVSLLILQFHNQCIKIRSLRCPELRIPDQRFLLRDKLGCQIPVVGSERTCLKRDNLLSARIIERDGCMIISIQGSLIIRPDPDRKLCLVKMSVLEQGLNLEIADSHL